jgi:hypothetical protein
MMQPDLLDAKLYNESWSAISGLRSEYRWHLGRRFDGEHPLMLVVGHNPSTADGQREDPTTRRWAHFARAWGHGGYIAVNLYPFRSPTVEICYAWRDGIMDWNEVEVGIAMERNFTTIVEQASICSRAVVCWGDLAREPGVVLRVADALSKIFPALYCFGYTKNMAPKHPMARGKSRVPDDFQPVPYPPLSA